MVDKQGYRQRGAAVSGDIFAPADAGVAVVRAFRRMLQLGIVQPREAGHKQKAADVAVLRQRAPLQHLPLPAAAQCDEILVRQVTLHRTVDVHAVRLHGGVGRRAPVELRHRAVLQNAAAQLGHGVGGAHHRIEKAEKEGTLPPVCHEIRNIDLRRNAGKGECHLPEIGKLSAAGIGSHVDDPVTHVSPPKTKTLRPT